MIVTQEKLPSSTVPLAFCVYNRKCQLLLCSEKIAQSWAKCLSHMYSVHIIHLGSLNHLIAQKHQITFFFPNKLHFKIYVFVSHLAFEAKTKTRVQSLRNHLTLLPFFLLLGELREGGKCLERR